MSGRKWLTGFNRKLVGRLVLRISKKVSPALSISGTPTFFLGESGGEEKQKREKEMDGKYLVILPKLLVFSDQLWPVCPFPSTMLGRLGRVAVVFGVVVVVSVVAVVSEPFSPFRHFFRFSFLVFCFRNFKVKR